MSIRFGILYNVCDVKNAASEKQIALPVFCALKVEGCHQRQRSIEMRNNDKQPLCEQKKNLIMSKMELSLTSQYNGLSLA